MPERRKSEDEKSAWEAYGHEAATEEEVKETTTSRVPLDLGTEEEEQREAARHTEVGIDPTEEVVEHQEYGAAVDLPRERRGPPPQRSSERAHRAPKEEGGD